MGVIYKIMKLLYFRGKYRITFLILHVITSYSIHYTKLYEDHVTPEQHPSLLKLLKELVQGGIANARFEGIELENMVMAAIKSSEYHQVNYEGRSLTVLHGCDLQNHEIALFPGQIPDHIPDPSFWQNKSLQIPVLRPPVTQGVHTHIRLDQALEFLLGDKMA